MVCKNDRKEAIQEAEKGDQTRQSKYKKFVDASLKAKVSNY